MRSSTLHRIPDRDEDFGSEEDQDAKESVNGVDVDAGVGVGGQATTPAEGDQGVGPEEEDQVDLTCRHDSPMVAGVPAVPVPVSSGVSEPPGAGMDSGRSSMSLTLTSRPSTLQRLAIILDSPRLSMSL